MALTQVTTSDVERVVLFMEKLMATEGEKKMFLRQFMGPTSDAAIQKIDALASGPSDKVTYSLRMKLTGRGRYGDDQLEGNEEGIVVHSDSLVVDLVRHATGRITVMSQKRTFINYSQESALALATWFAEWCDELLFIYLSGARGRNTGLFATDFTSFASNTVTAPDASHVFYAGNNSKTTMDATDKLLLDDLDQAGVLIDEMTATAGTPGMRPLNIGGQPRYLFIGSPRQKYHLTQVDSGTLLERINLAEIQGGNKSEYIFSDGLAYDKFVIYSSNNVRKFNATTEDGYTSVATGKVARGLILGAQAAVIGYGEPGGGFDNIRVKREVFDFQNQESYGGGLICGVKKTTFNSVDLGVFCVDSAVES